MNPSLRFSSPEPVLTPFQVSTTPSPPPSPILVYNPDLPWASESRPIDSIQITHAPHMRHPASHPLFDNPPSPVQFAPHCVSESPLPPPVNQLPHLNAVHPGPHHGPFGPPYTISTGDPVRNPNSSNLYAANGSHYQGNGGLNGYVRSQDNYVLDHSSPAAWDDSNMTLIDASISPLPDSSNQSLMYGQQASYQHAMPYVFSCT